MELHGGWKFEKTSLVYIVLVSLTGWLLTSSASFVAGVMAGGSIGVANFRWLRSIITGVISQGKAARYTVRYLAKFLAVIGISALLIYSKRVDPLGFLIGFTVPVLNVALLGNEFINRS